MDRLSKQQKAILLWIDEQPPYTGWGVAWHHNSAHVKWARWGLHHKSGRQRLTNSERASFSRSIRRLEARGLIIRRNYVSSRNMTMAIQLTDEGIKTVNVLRQLQDVNRLEKESTS